MDHKNLKEGEEEIKKRHEGVQCRRMRLSGGQAVQGLEFVDLEGGAESLSLTCLCGGVEEGTRGLDGHGGQGAVRDLSGGVSSAA